MRIRDRRPTDILRAPMQTRHWRALYGLVRTITPGGEALRRYVTQAGSYPWDIDIAVPMGSVPVRLYSRHDLLTVNEIFCRQDYGRDAPRLVVDIGANIGLAALFWLTRRNDSKVWCYEPDARNVERLRRTLQAHEGRFVVRQVAVGTEPGTARFASDESGRYGKLSPAGDTEVEVVALRDELARVEAAEGAPPDLVKLDTEGTEEALIRSLPPEMGADVLWEADGGHVRRHARGGHHSAK